MDPKSLPKQSPISEQLPAYVSQTNSASKLTIFAYDSFVFTGQEKHMLGRYVDEMMKLEKIVKSKFFLFSIINELYQTVL